MIIIQVVLEFDVLILIGPYYNFFYTTVIAVTTVQHEKIDFIHSLVTKYFLGQKN